MKLGGASFIVSAAKRVQHYGAIGLADLRDRSSRTRCSPRQTSAAIGHHVEICAVCAGTVDVSYANWL